MCRFSLVRLVTRLIAKSKRLQHRNDSVFGRVGWLVLVALFGIVNKHIKQTRLEAFLKRCRNGIHLWQSGSVPARKGNVSSLSPHVSLCAMRLRMVTPPGLALTCP